MMYFKKIGKSITLAALFGVALYVFVYFMASHSEAFDFVDRKIRISQVIKTRVGDIKKVRPGWLGPYEQKSVGSDEWVLMMVHVIGSIKTIEIDVKVKKENGIWMLENARIDEQTFDLN